MAAQPVRVFRPFAARYDLPEALVSDPREPVQPFRRVVKKNGRREIAMSFAKVCFKQILSI
jgi:hypothetical protein